MKEQKLMDGKMIAIGVLALFILIILISFSWVWGSYNTFVIAKEDINTQWGNIKTEYQRRADLFVNIVEVTKGYSNFEKSTLIQVTEARASATKITAGDFESISKTEQINQLNQLDSVFSRLLLTFERYPELKSIEQYNKLFEEIQRTENRIQIARTDYNTLVRSYNILIKRFPKNLLANSFGYGEELFFINQAGTEVSPKIKLG